MLLVPDESIELYKSTFPWSVFNYIYPISKEDSLGNIPEVCDTPAIKYENGQLQFSSNTYGASNHYRITASDHTAQETVSETGLVPLSAYYTISCYATADGLERSETSTARLYWLHADGKNDDTMIMVNQTRGIMVQSVGGFINISGLVNNEKVEFYGIDGTALGYATAINGNATFSAKTGSIVIAKIGKKNIKIMVE